MLPMRQKATSNLSYSYHATVRKVTAFILWGKDVLQIIASNTADATLSLCSSTCWHVNQGMSQFKCLQMPVMQQFALSKHGAAYLNPQIVKTNKNPPKSTTTLDLPDFRGLLLTCLLKLLKYFICLMLNFLYFNSFNATELAGKGFGGLPEISNTIVQHKYPSSLLERKNWLCKCHSPKTPPSKQTNLFFHVGALNQNIKQDLPFHYQLF